MFPMYMSHIIISIGYVRVHQLPQFGWNSLLKISRNILLGASIALLCNIILWPSTASKKLKRKIGQSIQGSIRLLRMNIENFGMPLNANIKKDETKER